MPSVHVSSVFQKHLVMRYRVESSGLWRPVVYTNASEDRPTSSFKVIISLRFTLLNYISLHFTPTPTPTATPTSLHFTSLHFTLMMTQIPSPKLTLHGVTTRKTSPWIFTVMKISILSLVMGLPPPDSLDRPTVCANLTWRVASLLRLLMLTERSPHASASESFQDFACNFVLVDHFAPG